jgi:Protein of unknown function (DUF1579)
VPSGHFTSDVTTGTVGGNSYYRLGILSYSTMDKRYEWNTVDALNTNMMTYKGAKGRASAQGDIVMSGEFTDQGVLGDAYAGKRVGQRTVIKIESPDHHVFECISHRRASGSGSLLAQNTHGGDGLDSREDHHQSDTAVAAVEVFASLCALLTTLVSTYS